MKKIWKVSLAAILSFVLAACGTDSGMDANKQESDSTGYPITIEHAFGKTVLDQKPERIATISWGNQDVPLALGVVPVGVSKANFGSVSQQGLHSWTQKAFEDLGVTNPVVFDDTDGLDFEAIADTSPDVILAAYSGLTQEDYDTLSQIAPVIAYPDKPWQTLWRQQVLLDAKGMGMEEEGKQLVADTEKLIQDKQKEYLQLEGKSAAFIWVDTSDTGSFYVYLPKDPRAAYLTDLGLSFPKSLEDQVKDADDFSISLSSEYADLLNDVDILVTYGDSTTLDLLRKDALFGKIKAIQRGSVVVLENDGELAGAATPTVLSIQATIDSYLKELATAADQV